MRTSVAVLLAVVLGVAAMAVQASASTLMLNGVSGETSNGYYVSPYSIMVDGSVLQMACDDFFIHINLGQSWQADRLTWADLTTAEKELYGPAYWLVRVILQGNGPHGRLPCLWRKEL